MPLVPDLGFPRKGKGLTVGLNRRTGHTGVNIHWVIHRSSDLFPSVDSAVDNSGQGLDHFHCVETPNPAAMKPKPTTMFQLPSGSIGSFPSVT